MQLILTRRINSVYFWMVQIVYGLFGERKWCLVYGKWSIDSVDVMIYGNNPCKECKDESLWQMF